MADDIFLTIIIPAYNEEANIERTLSEVYGYLKARGLASEIIVVDDGSCDDTLPKTLALKSKYDTLRVIESRPNRGKGHVVKKAMKEGKGKFLLFMDADNSTSVNEFDKFLPHLEEGYGMVIGSRRMKGADVTVPEPFLRILMGRAYIILSSLLFGVRLTDFNCGFKAFSADAADRLFSLQKMEDWSFDSELIYIARRLRIGIKEVPVKWAYKSTSKVKPLSAGIRSFISLLKIRRNGMQGLYGPKA